MRHTRRRGDRAAHRGLTAVAPAVALVALLAGVAAAVTDVSIDPGDLIVGSDDQFELSLRTAASGDTISGYQLYLSFDPAVIALSDATEGSLYVDSGHATWFRVEELEPGRWHFFDTVLGEGTHILPPGELLHLSFTVVDTGLSAVNADTVRLADVRREDLAVGAVGHSNVEVLPVSGVPDESPGLLRLGLARPNPFAAETSIEFRAARGAGAVEAGVFDVAGRIVRRLPIPPGSRCGVLRWDGRCDDGRKAPSSVYFVRVTDGREAVSASIVLLR